MIGAHRPIVEAEIDVGGQGRAGRMGARLRGHLAADAPPPKLSHQGWLAMAHALASHWSWPAPCCSLRQSKKQKSDHNQGATGSKRDQSGSGDLDQARAAARRPRPASAIEMMSAQATITRER